MPDDLRPRLQRIGLEQLSETFAASDIDFNVLPDLSDEDLKELGLSLGHRRRLLRAIAELASEQSQLATGSPEASSGAGRQAERRQLTVLFCDLVGSTELSGRYDPEDLRELLRRYHDTMTAVVLRYGGYVANYIGDGILAYFGWPRAEEDEAAQAIRAGLAAVAAVKQLSLQVHVGIASGTVVVGDLDSAGRRQAGAIAGETPNLAARLETLAGPDQIVIGGLTRQLIGNAFVLDDLGPRELKGIAEPVRAWQVLAERSVESRFDARAGRLTRFIGREHELALLIDRFELAAAGEGQAVLLSGEAGIGKSRILRQLHERLAGTSYTRLRFQCSPSHTESALYPVIRHLEFAARFQPDDEPETRLDKLEALLGQAVEHVRESAALLAPLLSLPAAERYGSIELNAEQRSDRTLKALIDQVLGLAAKEPVLYILEDAHWIDPTTRELVTRTLGRITDARVLMLITHRPDFQSDWARRPQVTALTLSRLSRVHGTEVARAAGGQALSEEVVARISRRSDGVPLYIEELTRSVIETGNAAGDTDIPETLQASLLARLDRLGPDAKEVAQIASVIGREFSGALLGAVSDKPKDEVDRSVQRLVASEIVLPTGPAQDSFCAFRHALIQDAAYQSLLLSRRRQYHGEIARTLQQSFPEIAENQPDLVAQHYTAAELPEQAIPYWLRAGERATARQAFQEPAAHFERGLQLARALPEGPARSRHVLDLLLALGDARARAGPYQECFDAYKEAAELAREVGSPADLVRAALGFEDADLLMGRGADREAVPLLEDALAALGQGESVERCRVLSRLGRALFEIGLTDRANKLLRDATDIARSLGDRYALFDALVCEHITTTGYPWREQEFPERSKTLDEIVAMAEEIDDPGLISRAEFRRMPALLEMADLTRFEASLARLGTIAEQHKLVGELWGLASARAMQAILHGEFANAEHLAERALEQAPGMRADIATGVYSVQMFTIRREQGRLAEVAPLFRRFLDENPQDAAWRPGLALIASDLGFEEAARKSLLDLAAGGFAFPIDAKRSLTLSYVAEVCARLRDTLCAERLYSLLLPYRDVTVIAPVSTVCCGSAARYLGMLAGVIGDWAGTEEHFEAALEMDERLQAWPWLAHTQHEFAAALLARGAPGDRVRADRLLVAAAETAQRLSMTSLQQKIRSLAH
jgi:class 3 adenylate cyclase/tetratricopeptide (TPR) repeat protein